MAIRQRGNKLQVDVKVPKKLQTQQGTTRVRETCDTMEEARVLENDIRGTFLKGQTWQRKRASAGSRRVTLGDVYQITYNRFWKDCKSAETAEKNAKTVRDFFGDETPIRDIDTTRVDEFVDDLKDRGRSNATINRKLAALSKMLSVAQDRGYISAKPKIDRPREGKGRILTIDDTAMGESGLLGYFKQVDSEAHDLCVVLIDTGMRVGEALKLKPRDIDGQYIRLYETKNDEPRSIPMTKRVQQIVAARRETRKRTENLFDLDKWSFRRAWDRMKAAHGEEENRQLVPHCLRHTFCSRLVRKGVHFGVVQKLAGHKTIQTTLRYSHLAPSNLDEAVSVLEPA